MAQYPTKLLANTGNNSPSSAGNSGYTGKYYIFDYFVSGTSAAVTATPIGILPCKAHYVGCSVVMAAGTAGTLNVTVSPKIIPFDTGVAASLNSTDPVLGTGIVAFPADTQTVNFDGAGAVTTHGQNGTGTATGITDAVLKTGSAAQARQGDIIAVTTSGTFTGSGGLLVQVIFQEDNGNGF